MRDDQGRAFSHDLGQGCLHVVFTFGIKRTGGFVEQKNLGVFEDGPRNCDPLFLAARQTHATLAEITVVLIR